MNGTTEMLLTPGQGLAWNQFPWTAALTLLFGNVQYYYATFTQLTFHSVSIKNYHSYMPVHIRTGALCPSAIIVMHKKPKQHHLFLHMHLQV
jgi:hypothetical protein